MRTTIRERDILHETGDFWVADQGSCYTVFKNGITGSTSDSSYTHDADGLSLAIARTNYLAAKYTKDLPPDDGESDQ